MLDLALRHCKYKIEYCIKAALPPRPDDYHETFVEEGTDKLFNKCDVLVNFTPGRRCRNLYYKLITTDNINDITCMGCIKNHVPTELYKFNTPGDIEKILRNEE